MTPEERADGLMLDITAYELAEHPRAVRRWIAQEIRNAVEDDRRARRRTIDTLRLALSFYADADRYFGFTTSKPSMVWTVKHVLAQSALDVTGESHDP